MSFPWIRGLFIGSAVIGIGAISYMQLMTVTNASPAPSESPRHTWPGAEPGVLFSAPGVTEPASRTLQIYSEVPGVIRQIHVKSGDHITVGQSLFELANDTEAAEVHHSETLVEVAKVNLAKVESWEREEDRRLTLAQWEEAKAMMQLSAYEQERVASLMPQDAASDKELIYARENLAAAKARVDAAKARYDRSIAGPTKEELEVARVAVAEAEANLQITKTQFEKTIIRSPIDGIVVYRYQEPGEAVTTDNPTPVLSIGNRQTLHIRADVDETDLGRVKLGQRVFALADAFGERRFVGKVIHIEQTLGRKNFRTYRPTEKSDTKILEVVIALDEGDELPLDLQMSLWFMDPNLPVVSNAEATTQPANTNG